MGNYVDSDWLIDKLNTVNMLLRENKNRIFNYENIDYLFERTIELIKANTVSIDTTNDCSD